MIYFDLRLQELRTRTKKLPGTSGSEEKLYHNTELNCKERSFNGCKKPQEKKLDKINVILLTKHWTRTGNEGFYQLPSVRLLAQAIFHGLFFFSTTIFHEGDLHDLHQEADLLYSKDFSWKYYVFQLFISIIHTFSSLIYNQCGLKYFLRLVSRLDLLLSLINQAKWLY